MMLGIPVPNASLYLSQEVEAASLGQVSEIANQVCDSVFVASVRVMGMIDKATVATVPLGLDRCIARIRRPLAAYNVLAAVA